MRKIERKDRRDFYTYAYLRQSDSVTAEARTPYYIGKGNKKRAYQVRGRKIVPPKEIGRAHV